ncbi:MAG: CoA transferase [Xanthobacteraceae bacterium]
MSEVRMLERIRVIEIGQVLAGPYASTILADLGADVVKVEKPELGDDAPAHGRGVPARRFAAFPRHQSQQSVGHARS